MENITQTTSVTKEELVREKLKAAFNYNTYRNDVSELASKGLSSGIQQSEANADYTRLNDARMRRLDKTIRVPEKIEERFRNFQGDQTWLVITESWCGDAAQSIPAMNKLATLSEDIDLKLIYRDSHPELMDAFLTNGARSIPKLIAIDNESGNIINEWGPRPSAATVMAENYKAEHGNLSASFKQDLQVWYNKDKGLTTIQDLAELI
ncbi:MAG: thioredoxin family protein [Flavobacterium sp.]|nr:MAG: thioredoxin family protein [Flavobacterium sp.]